MSKKKTEKKNALHMINKIFNNTFLLLKLFSFFLINFIFQYELISLSLYFVFVIAFTILSKILVRFIIHNILLSAFELFFLAFPTTIMHLWSKCSLCIHAIIHLSCDLQLLLDNKEFNYANHKQIEGYTYKDKCFFVNAKSFTYHDEGEKCI